MLPSPKTADIDSTLSSGVVSTWPEISIPQVEDWRVRECEINWTSHEPRFEFFKTNFHRCGASSEPISAGSDTKAQCFTGAV